MLRKIDSLAKHNNIHLKKALGQHFLTDKNVLHAINDVIQLETKDLALLEVGPGAGALTQYLQKRPNYKIVEYDERWVEHLCESYPHLCQNIYHQDFLKADLKQLFEEEFAVVGNFPYNISSQIVFKILDDYNRIPIVIGMFQKEVAERICASPGSKKIGILSYLSQLYYETHYLFDVPRDAFNPPPKVVSGVLMMKRKTSTYTVDTSFFKTVVKTAFNQRRKTLRNSLKGIVKDKAIFQLTIFDKRPEQLTLEAFVNLTNMIKYNS